MRSDLTRSLRFQEGTGSDPDVASEFDRAVDRARSSSVRPNQANRANQHKSREETMRERSHIRSASWVEAPDHLAQFAEGSADDTRGSYASEQRSGLHTGRPAHAKIWD
jgi:hypothetical protein